MVPCSTARKRSLGKVGQVESPLKKCAMLSSNEHRVENTHPLQSVLRCCLHCICPCCIALCVSGAGCIALCVRGACCIAWCVRGAGCIALCVRGVGGVRATVGLRSYLSELGCISVSATLPIGGAWKAFNEVN